MTENKFNLICKIKGCKIKSKIAGYIEPNYPEMAQGQDDFRFKVHLDFEEGDIPSGAELSCEPSEGFEPVESYKTDITGQSLDIELPVVYVNAPVGYYTIEGRVIHDEFGTELAKLEAGFFYLKVPELKMLSCTVDPIYVKHGDKLEINVVLSSTAKQKIKGTIHGKLKPSGESSPARVFELEPQKISIKGERTATWTLRIPKDEENTADYLADFKFESKETQSEGHFENVMKLRHLRDVEILSLKSDVPLLSESDKVTFTGQIKNVGIEKVKVKIALTIDGPEGLSISLHPEDTEIEREEVHEASWTWQVPEDAPYGFYQLNISWEFPDTGENGSLPGEAIEIAAQHIIEIRTVTTDKDYYLSGQAVRFQFFLMDTGTRAARNPLTIDYNISGEDGNTLYEDSVEKLIEKNGTEISSDWTIPDDLSSGSLDVTVAVRSTYAELSRRRFEKLINVEQPVMLRFNIVRPKLFSRKKSSKYLFEGEESISEERYHDLKILNLSSDTNLLLYKNEVVGGLDWSNRSINDKRTAEDLFFSHLMLKRGINLEKMQKMRNHWNEIGFVWTLKLKSVGRALELMTKNDPSHLKRYKNAFQIKNIDISNKSIYGLINYLVSGSTDQNTWKNYIQALIAPVKFAEYKKIPEVMKYTHNDDSGKAVISLIMEYLELGMIKSRGKYATALNDFIQTMNKNLSLTEPRTEETISRSLEKLYLSIKNQRIEVEPDDKIAVLIDFLYCLVMLKMIDKIVESIDTVLRDNKITKMQFLRLCFAQVSYHLLIIEYLQFKIRCNRFLAEELTQEEITRHYSSIEELGTELETILTNTMELFRNHHKNMNFRLQAAALYDKILLSEESGFISGLLGDHVRKKLKFVNRSERGLWLNILLAFPSPDWHIIEPELGLLDGVYRLVDIVVPKLGKVDLEINVAFPKTLSHDEYKCLIKFEPIITELLSEK